jgi:hypothetical protein
MRPLRLPVRALAMALPASTLASAQFTVDASASDVGAVPPAATGIRTASSAEPPRPGLLGIPRCRTTRH